MYAGSHRIGTIVRMWTVSQHGKYTHEPVDYWAHYSGRFCLIGDSAHAMSPYIAQSAAMGIEDAAILGGLFEAFPETQDLTESLALHEISV